MQRRAKTAAFLFLIASKISIVVGFNVPTTRQRLFIALTESTGPRLIHTHIYIPTDEYVQMVDRWRMKPFYSIHDLSHHMLSSHECFVCCSVAYILIRFDGILALATIHVKRKSPYSVCSTSATKLLSFGNAAIGHCRLLLIAFSLSLSVPLAHSRTRIWLALRTSHAHNLSRYLSSCDRNVIAYNFIPTLYALPFVLPGPGTNWITHAAACTSWTHLFIWFDWPTLCQQQRRRRRRRDEIL